MGVKPYLLLLARMLFWGLAGAGPGGLISGFGSAIVVSFWGAVFASPDDLWGFLVIAWFICGTAMGAFVGFLLGILFAIVREQRSV